MKQTKFDTLLIIRGLLAVAVVVWHITTYGNSIPAFVNLPGRTAVWIFFGISGYVISYGFFTNRYTLKANDLKAFYINRFLRIYPLFLLLSLLAMFTEYMLTGKYLVGIQDIPSQFLMFQINHEYVLNSVFWTLGIEVQFYLIAPLLILLFMGKTKYVLLLGVYGLFVLWLPFAFYILGISFDGRNLVSNLSHFFIGIIGCRLVTDAKMPKLNNYLLIGAILAIIVCTNYFYANAIRYYWSLGTVMIDLVIFLAICLHANMEKTGRDVNGPFLKVFSFLGVISYGVYAWHPYLIKYIPWLENNILPAVAVTIGVSFLSFSLVEQPVLRLKQQRKKIVEVP